MFQRHLFSHGYFLLEDYAVAPFVGRTFGAVYLPEECNSDGCRPFFTHRSSRWLIKLYHQLASPAHAWYDGERDEFIFMPTSAQPQDGERFAGVEVAEQGIRSGAYSFSDGFDRFPIGSAYWRWRLSDRIRR